MPGKKELLLNSEMQPAVAPQVQSGNGTLTGAIYDRTNFMSALLGIAVGAVTGSPTGLSVVATIQHGDAVDDEANPTTITDVEATTEVLTITGAQAGSVDDFINIDLDGLKKWIQVSVEVTFTDGTTPTAAVVGTYTFGDPRLTEAVAQAQNV